MAFLLIYSRNSHRRRGTVYHHVPCVRHNYDFREDDDLGRKCVHTDGIWLGFQRVFSHNSGTGALCLNHVFETK